MRPQPKCFCKPPVPECPVCTKPDYSKMRPSNGDATRDHRVSQRLQSQRDRLRPSA